MENLLKYFEEHKWVGSNDRTIGYMEARKKFNTERFPYVIVSYWYTKYDGAAEYGNITIHINHFRQRRLYHYGSDCIQLTPVELINILELFE